MEVQKHFLMHLIAKGLVLLLVISYMITYILLAISEVTRPRLPIGNPPGTCSTSILSSRAGGMVAVVFAVAIKRTWDKSKATFK